MGFVSLALVERVCHIVVKASITHKVDLEVCVHLRRNGLTSLCILLKTGVCYRESIANEHLAKVKRVARDEVSQRKPDNTLATRWACTTDHIREVCVADIELDRQMVGSTRPNGTAVQAAETEHLAFSF